MDRTISQARVVALALLCVVLGGLAFVRLGGAADRLEVPAGAAAGDFTSEPCRYETELGPRAADCGTLVVPEHRGDPSSRLLALPVTRLRARSDSPARPVFRLGGGPGRTNLSFATADRLADDHDVVLVGYRGVDGSSVLDCPEVTTALRHAQDLAGESSQRAYANAFQTCAARLTVEGVDLDGYTLAERVDDLEAARTALGYEQVDVVSEGAGTRTALLWSWRHPRSLHRSVMLGANPPGGFVRDPAAVDEQVRRVAARCAQDASCRRRTDDLAETLRADVPDRWGPLPIAPGNVAMSALPGFVGPTAEAAPLSSTVDSWLAAQEGDARGLWLGSLVVDLLLPTSSVWGDVAAVTRADADAARVHFAQPARDAVLGEAATSFLWGGGRLADAWPATPDDDAYDRMRTSDVETLVVSGELDLQTPPQTATRVLLPHLAHGSHVVLEGFGPPEDFWAFQTAAGERLITSFLATGEADASLYVPHEVDVTPGLTQAELATWVVSGLVALAAVTGASLLLVARLVSQRGRLGRRAGAVLRSVHAVVLGLGGWCAGVLVVLVTMPGVPLDDPTLAVVSIGVPVGLGVWLAGLDRADAAGRRAALLGAAAAGAVLGAGLGHAAAAEVLALVTGVVGAVAGANLAVVVLDVLRPRTGADVPVQAPGERVAVPASVRSAGG